MISFWLLVFIAGFTIPAMLLGYRVGVLSLAALMMTCAYVMVSTNAPPE